MYRLTTPTKARLHEIKNKRIKLGQKGSKDGITINYMTVQSNTFLDVLDPSGGLRKALYRQASAAEKAKIKPQAGLEGMEVTDTPELTEAGKAIGAMPWVQEQTGCTFTIDYGVGGKSNLTVREATSTTQKVTLQEGGSVKVYAQIHGATDYMSDEQFGKLHRLHQSDPKVTLVGPQLDGQVDVEDGDDDKATPTGGGVVTPIAALASADRNARSKPTGKEAAAGAN